MVAYDALQTKNNTKPRQAKNNTIPSEVRPAAYVPTPAVAGVTVDPGASTTVAFPPKPVHQFNHRVGVECGACGLRTKIDHERTPDCETASVALCIV